MYTESYFNSVSSLMDEEFKAQRDKIKLSNETKLLISDRGKKNQISGHTTQFNQSTIMICFTSAENRDDHTELYSIFTMKI